MNTTLTLTQKWDKVFPLSEKVSHKKVTFMTQYGLTLAADMYIPASSDPSKGRGEKMAANYYSFDKAFGLQDYNYYQLGVVTGPTKAYLDASTSSKFIYEYPEAEDALDDVVAAAG